MTFFSTLIFLASPSLNAQKQTDLKKTGERFFENRRWQSAAAVWNIFQEENPSDLSVSTRLGICYLQLHDAEKAEKCLNAVLTKKPNSDDPQLFYALARLAHARQDWSRAVFYYKIFLKHASNRHEYRANAVDNIRRCAVGMAAQTDPNLALVENLSEAVNSPGDEFAPLLSVNHSGRLYFAAAREDATGGLRDDFGLADGERGHPRSDLFFSDQTAVGWGAPQPLPALLNTPRCEAPLAFASGGRVLFFYRGFTMFGGEILADTAGRADEHAVQPPEFQGPMRPEQGDEGLFFFNDSTIIFASRRPMPGAQGGLDLYFSRNSGSFWTPPVNLGPAVNSAYDETTPCLARDGRTLFFSCNGLASVGGLDVFKTVFDEKTASWSAPQSLGLGINSPGDDAFFRLADDAKTAYLASDRLESLGERDLFIIFFKDELPEGRPDGGQPFFAVSNLPAGEKTDSGGTAAAADTLLIAPLNYENDADVLNPENLKTLETVLAKAAGFQQLTLLVTAHTDATGPEKFDLYQGIKRAEVVGKFLAGRGIPAARIVLRSVGAGYPLAKTVVGAADNPLGQKLNRRIEIGFAQTSGEQAVFSKINRPPLSEIMAADGARILDEMTAGLSFKVEMIATRQIFTSDLLGMFGDLMIESTPGSGTYRYTAGFFKKYEEAAQLRREIQAQELPGAQVVAYVEGLRVTRAEAVALVKKYPGLAAFVKGG